MNSYLFLGKIKIIVTQISEKFSFRFVQKKWPPIPEKREKLCIYQDCINLMGVGGGKYISFVYVLIQIFYILTFKDAFEIATVHQTFLNVFGTQACQLGRALKRR